MRGGVRISYMHFRLPGRKLRTCIIHLKKTVARTGVYKVKSSN